MAGRHASSVWPNRTVRPICKLPQDQDADPEEGGHAMFAPLFRTLERQVDVFAPFDETATPPRGVWPFMWHHIKGVKGWLALIMLTASASAASRRRCI